MECSNIKFRPCLASQECYDGESSTAACWILTFAQLLLASLFLSFPALRKKINNVWCSARDSGKAASSIDFFRVEDEMIENSTCIDAKVSSLRIPKALRNMNDMSRRSPTFIPTSATPSLTQIKFHLSTSVQQGTEDFLPEMIASEGDIVPQDDVETRPPLGAQNSLVKFDFSSTTSTSTHSICSIPQGSEDFLPDIIEDDKEDLHKLDKDDSLLHAWQLQRSISPVFKTKRSEENFMKGNVNETIEYPSDYQPEYITLHQNNGATTMGVLNTIFSQKEFQDMIRISAAFAFLSAGTASFFGIFFSYGEYVQENCEGDGDMYMHIKTWLLSGADALDHTVNSFQFLPIFLVLAAFAFLVDRWQRFMVTCHTIQGRLHDIGILCGTLPSTPVTKSSQRKLYTIYRYLNVIHILCLKSFSPSLKELNDDLSIFATKLNLLTEEEVDIVSTMENKARDGMITLLSLAIDDLLVKSNKEQVLIPKGTVLSTKVCDLRSECSKLHDLFVRDNPNEYTVSIGIFINIFKTLVVLSSPLGLFQESTYGILACIQPGVFLGVFFTFLSLSFPFVLFKALQNPFAENGGIDTDNLIASTEMCLFQTTRVLWHKVDQHHSLRRTCSSPRVDRVHFSSSRKKSSLGKSFKGEFGEL
jgi:hypothetical protein